MTTYYVDPTNGNDADDGLSWADAFLTLNGAEDEPVAAGDTVYVAPGIYREMLTCDVAGTNGNPITYIGDVTGENTDSVGGVVRITGSDDDQAVDRNQCITAAAGKHYRTFRGFRFDGTLYAVLATDTTDWIIEDCVTSGCGIGVWIAGTDQADWIVRRCFTNGGVGVSVTHSADVDDTGHLIENCVFLSGMNGNAFTITNVGGGTIKNCLFAFGRYAIRISSALTEGQQWDVNNCIIHHYEKIFNATAIGEIIEDYNSIWYYVTVRVNTDTGANSNTFMTLENLPILLDGFQLPWWYGELSEWSQVAAITGTGESADDLLGMARPATASKKSWGAVQFDDISRSGTQKEAGSYSAKLADAGRMQIKVPVTAVSTTISCEVYREVNYAGTAPQMIIKQPGQSDDTTTDGAAAEQFNELTTTLTPAALPPYVIIELVSNNTAAAGDYNVYFDTLAVS